MKNKMRVILFISINFSLMACSLGNLIKIDFGGDPTEPVPTQITVLVQSEDDLEICSLLEKADAENILGETVGEPKDINGSCVFSNAKDSLYMVSIAVGQDELAKGILQGQAMMMGFAGTPLDDARMAVLKSFSDTLDFKAFFTELVTAAEGLPSPKAIMVADQKSDLVFWAWIMAQSRRQASLVAVRGPSVVNINLIVADSMSEEAMLAASLALADKIFDRLPPKFSIAPSAETPEPSDVSGNQSPVGTPTPIDVPQVVGTPTWVGGPTPVGGPTLVVGPTPVGIPTLVGKPTLVGVPTPVGGPTPVG